MKTPLLAPTFEEEQALKYQIMFDFFSWQYELKKPQPRFILINPDGTEPPALKILSEYQPIVISWKAIADWASCNLDPSLLIDRHRQKMFSNASTIKEMKSIDHKISPDVWRLDQETS